MTTQLSANPCDPVEQGMRQQLLDDLYRRDGRDRRGHPMHALYTGLWQHWTGTTTQPEPNEARQ